MLKFADTYLTSELQTSVTNDYQVVIESNNSYVISCLKDISKKPTSEEELVFEVQRLVDNLPAKVVCTHTTNPRIKTASKGTVPTVETEGESLSELFESGAFDDDSDF